MRAEHILGIDATTMERVHVTVPKEQMNELRMHCAQSGVPVSEHIRKAIEAYLPSAELKQWMNGRFNELDATLDSAEARCADIEAKLDTVVATLLGDEK